MASERGSVMGELSLAWPEGRRAEEACADREERLRAGDPELFGELIECHQDALIGYLVRMTRCPDRAQELAQEAFVRLFTSRRRYSEQGLLSAYLFRIATNLLRSEERRRTRWRRLEPLYLAGLREHPPSPQRELEGQEACGRVSRAIAGLPVRFRAPLVLREIEGWSYAEIARTLGCREGTVKSRINRAKKRLKDELEPFWRQQRGELGAAAAAADSADGVADV
ncbi:MAG: RNA polymerase subunit sigma-70 [Acidobacteria bacterium]|nr:MAG: RNA polymerase subunit sigma-70 [Acidobacteriota bacterium]REK10127.1 MAG: RNA polymerase subunit sigma-70 [Acidobacteriota bacterium]